MGDAEPRDKNQQLKNRRWMERKIRKVRFVEFDRFTVGEWGDEQSVTVYGWMVRDDDYKDFLLIIFWPEREDFYFATSSAERTEDIYRALVADDLEEHHECRRVEDAFNVDNAVELEDR